MPKVSLGPCNPTFDKRIRQNPKPIMNKLEAEFHRITFAVLNEPVYIQSIKFKLANGLTYTPDFVCPRWPWESYEVKGPHAFDGALDKLKIAATIFPHIKWVLVWKENGVWKNQVVLS